jgi:hypothetical protein
LTDEGAITAWRPHKYCASFLLSFELSVRLITIPSPDGQRPKLVQIKAITILIHRQKDEVRAMETTALGKLAKEQRVSHSFHSPTAGYIDKEKTQNKGTANLEIPGNLCGLQPWSNQHFSEV